MKCNSITSSIFQKILIFSAIIFSSFWNRPAFAQTSAPTGIFADTVYSSVKLTSDIVYGSNYNPFYNRVDTLKLDIYEPDTTIDYLRPMIIYIHGSFQGGDKARDKATVFGNYFAKCGYLYASINYRLYIDDPDDTIDNFEGVYMSTQDVKSAVRFFRKNADQYCLDTSRIFLIGTSAGAALCLTTAYWDQDEADQFFNTSDFGPLENSSGNEGYSSQPTAIIACWGGIPDTSWLEHETTPNQLFHGTEDPSVPFISGLSENGVHLFGSYTIHEASIANGIESRFHPLRGAGHGVSSTSPKFDTVLQISTNFLFYHLKPGTGFIPCQLTTVGDTLRHGDISVSSLNSDHFMIQNNQDHILSGLLRIYSLGGNLVRSSNITIASGSNVQVDCSSLIAGSYLVQISGENVNRVFKIFIKM